MSSKNRVNPDHYKIAGRDTVSKEAARARVKSNLMAKRELKNPRRIPKAGGKSSGKVKSKETRPTIAAAEDQASGPSADELQTSGKIGVISGAKKQDKARHFTGPTPQTNPVAGAFGKTGSLTETEEEMVHPEEDADSDRTDFIAQRRRQDRRAKK